VLAALDLTIEAGQKVLLVGPSGSGKSTLLRALAGLLLTADVGDLTGRVRIDGQAPQDTPGQVGLLLQDPTAALVAGTVGRDVAFGLENTQIPPDQMPRLVRRALEAASFPYGERRRSDSLSGGETQRLALAGSLALKPSVLLLDEPTSMLDDANSARVRRAVLESVETSGTTLVVVEHRLGPWVSQMDRCIVLDAEGHIIADGSPGSVLDHDVDSLVAQGIWVPGAPDPEPMEVDLALVRPRDPLPTGESLVVAKDIRVLHRSPFSRGRGDGQLALSDVSCELRSGRVLALTGPSGAGKSSLLAVLAGLQKVDAGTCEIRPEWSGRQGGSVSRLTSRELARRLAWVPQLSEHALVRHTVVEELMLTARALRLSQDAARDRAMGLLDVLGLGGLAHANAHRLSGGEQRRVVIAAALVHGPDGLLLDEPTVAQDRLTWSAVTGVCAAARRAGAGLVVATHDETAVNLLTGSGGGRRLRLASGRPLAGGS